MPWPDPVTFKGQHASLLPLSHDHATALAAAARDGELWKLWYTAVPSPEGMAAEIDRRLALQAAGSMLPWTVLDASGQAVGMTTYMNIDAAHKRVEIGSTWYASWAGGILTLGALGGAIVSHITVLGIEVQGDHGTLFGMAVLTFVSAFVVTFLHRHEIPSYTPMTPY